MRLRDPLMSLCLFGGFTTAIAAFEYEADTEFYRPGPGAIQAAISHIEALEAEGRGADAAKVREAIGEPMTVWITQGSPDAVETQVKQVMSAAGAHGQIPVFAAYNLPFRDCAQYSAGGATTVDNYNAWIDGLLAGIGNGDAIVILEPDGLAIIPHATTVDGELDWCQPDEGNPQTDEAERYDMTRYAVTALTANPDTKVYLDGGHADWHPPREIAARLLRANVQDADGFFLNVSNYVATDRQIGHGERVAKCVFWGLQGNDTIDCTDDDAFYAQNVDPLIAQMGDDDVSHFVIDTSRNGNGVWSTDAPYPDAQTWCNPPDRALGLRATTETGSPYADAYLWIKIPGESDGSCTRGLTDQDGVDPEWDMVGPAAGAWFPEQIETLVGATNE